MNNETPDQDDTRSLESRLRAFASAGYEEQIQLFQQTLADGLMDATTAFEMLQALFTQTAAHDQRRRFSESVANLRRQQPEIAAANAHWLCHWQITHALVDGRSADLPSLGQEMAQTAGTHLDLFRQTLDALAYHGDLSHLVDMMRQAWPLIQQSGEVAGRGIDAFATRATDATIFHYLETRAAPDAHDPSLRQQLEVYFDIDVHGLARYLAHLTGQTERAWRMSDFDFAAQGKEETVSKRKKGNQAVQNLSTLLIEFVGYLRRQDDVPYSRGDLFRQQLPQYLVARRTGQLAPRDVTNLMGSGRPMPPRPEPQSRHPLCPDADTLERYLAKLLHFANPHPYRAAVLFELTPAWLRFLESNRLIDAPQHQQTLQDLKTLKPDLTRYWEQYPEDPALQREAEKWPG